MSSWGTRVGPIDSGESEYLYTTTVSAPQGPGQSGELIIPHHLELSVWDPRCFSTPYPCVGPATSGGVRIVFGQRAVKNDATMTAERATAAVVVCGRVAVWGGAAPGRWSRLDWAGAGRAVLTLVQLAGSVVGWVL